MTLFYMTSLHVDLNEATKCVDITTHYASLPLVALHTRTEYKMATIFGLTYKRLVVKFMNVQGTKTWKELTTGVQLLLRLLFNNNFINPGLVL